MSGYGHLNQALEQRLSTSSVDKLTLGVVVDTNDPQQMGRIRVFCAGFGDTKEKELQHIPWAIHISPLAGVTNFGKRGAPPEKGDPKRPTEGAEDASDSEGSVTYGMWNVPKIGAHVLVGCIEGDTGLRFWIGCIHPQYLTHTMPHGRYLWSKDDGDKLPDGPVDTIENPIEPLYTNLEKSFTKKGLDLVEETPSQPRKNMEWRSRGADLQAAAINSDQLESDEGPGSEVADHDPKDFSFTKVTEEDGRVKTIEGAGYGVSQLEPDARYDTTRYNYDSHVYSWTTPGFHSIAMDDRHWNCRMRFRTTAGHQILLDDTNERIYISTAQGETWIELDRVGNVDIHASRNLSVHSGGDINFTTDQTFRVYAKQGIHMFSESEMRLHSIDDMNLRTEHNFRLHNIHEYFHESGGNMYIRTRPDSTDPKDSRSQFGNPSPQGGNLYLEVDKQIHIESVSAQGGIFIETAAATDIHIDSGQHLFGTAAKNIDFQATGGTWHQQSGGIMHLLSGGNMAGDAPRIDWNSGVAGLATAATPAQSSQKAEEKWSYWTNRVPQHEPWARVFMKRTGEEGADNDGKSITSPADKKFEQQHKPEYTYTDQNVGRKSEERKPEDEDYERNPLWHR